MSRRTTYHPIDQVAETKVKSGRKGPFTNTRDLLARANSLGARGLTYHVSRALDAFQKTYPHIFFTNGDYFSRHQLPEHHREVLGRCHHFISLMGKPILLSTYIGAFSKAEPALAEEITTAAFERAEVVDQLMVPVFGPFSINGVLTFAFDRVLDWKKDAFLEELEKHAAAYHNTMVRHFANSEEAKTLSAREKEVLTWIARGKKNPEIATILGLSEGTIDTYVRRIFEKLEVRDRVTAVVGAIHRGLLV